MSETNDSVERLVMLRKRRLTRMTEDELHRLNGILVGKGPNWATQERIDVCEELGKRLAEHYCNITKRLRAEGLAHRRAIT